MAEAEPAGLEVQQPSYLPSDISPLIKSCVQASSPAALPEACMLSLRVSSGQGMLRLKEGGATTGAVQKDAKKGSANFLSCARDWFFFFITFL
jgi:hypothetical protein